MKEMLYQTFFESVEYESVEPKVQAERIILKQKLPEGERYLVKWEGYHPQESTWESADHISEALLDSYLCPSVCDIRLSYAALTFESAIQQCLTSKATSVSTRFPLDIYRYVFGTDRSVVIKAASEMEKLPLSGNWTYKLDQTGRGVKILFPIRLTPRCFMKPVYVRSDVDASVSKMSMPVEKLTIICPIGPTY